MSRHRAGPPARASQRRTPAPAEAPAIRLRPGDTVRWCYYAGEVLLVTEGMALIRCTTDGRKWRLPLAELTLVLPPQPVP